MKKLAIILAVAALSGCATQYPGPANYGSRAYAQAPDANGWQVVSVTPVPNGTAAQPGAVQHHLRYPAGLRTGTGVCAGPRLRSVLEPADLDRPRLQLE
jgi:hypothetical protein